MRVGLLGTIPKIDLTLGNLGSEVLDRALPLAYHSTPSKLVDLARNGSDVNYGRHLVKI